jgi:hypothetical protein
VRTDEASIVTTRHVCPIFQQNPNNGVGSRLSRRRHQRRFPFRVDAIDEMRAAVAANQPLNEMCVVTSNGIHEDYTINVLMFSSVPSAVGSDISARPLPEPS